MHLEHIVGKVSKEVSQYLKWTPKEIPEEGERYDAIIHCLQSSMEKQCVLCLQEVEEDFFKRLEIIFKEGGYACHWVPRGGTVEKREFTGNMGWLVAYPTTMYTEVCCVKDFRFGKDEDYWKTTVIKHQTITKYDQEITIYERLAEYFDISPLYVKLQHQHTKQYIGVATFHMPCEFEMPMVAAGYAVLLGEWLTRVNKESGGEPYVLVGDMNSRTEDPTYGFFTNPTANTTDNEKILYGLAGVAGNNSFCGLVDAWQGDEQPTTNTYWREGNEHHSAIDYVFHTSSLCTMAKTIPDAPSPLIGWPSDHKMVQVSLVASEKE